MGEGQAHGFVLTIHVGAADIPTEAAALIVRDLDHLSAVLSPADPGTLVLCCTVSATSEPDAVRYGAQRMITAMLGAGIDAPRVLSVDSTLFDHALV